MVRSTRMVGLLMLASVAFAALARPPYVDIEKRLTAEQQRATGIDTLSREQLELLNRLLREEAAATAKSEPPHRDDEPRNDAFIGFNDKPITSRVKGTVAGWEPGTIFELDNGQQWKVLKGSVKLPEARQSPEILVVPGIAGRWFLQVDEDLPKARVYRID